MVNMKPSNRMKCNNIEYRKGFIEVEAGIHAGCINLETWEVNADIDISNLNLSDNELPDEGIVANTEIELNIDEAEQLIRLLHRAINNVRPQNGGKDLGRGAHNI